MGSNSGRWRLVAVAVAMMVWVPLPAMASRHADPTVKLEQRFLTWLFGSDANPIVRDGFCGEKVGGEFFLNVAVTPSATINCVIPRGVPVVATPGGALRSVPTDAATPAGLSDALDNTVQSTDPVAVLDGRSLADELRFARTGVYTMVVGKNSFLRTVDNPDFPADLKRTSVMSYAWMLRFERLSPGKHTLKLAAKIGGEPVSITFKIRVR